MTPQPAHRAGSAKSSNCLNPARIAARTLTSTLSPVPRSRTSGLVAKDLFDQRLRALRRDRAFRRGPELFLFQRAFDDICERLSLVSRRFSAALLVGCPDPSWPERLLERADSVDVIDPGQLFARAAGGTSGQEEQLELRPGAYDLCATVGTLDTVNDLARALLLVRFALREDSLFLGALSGGDTLPRLRAAMRAADEHMGGASPHVHPRIEPAALASLLSATGFDMPVVDVDRVQVAYSSLPDLVHDLRAMGATNVLSARPKIPLTRTAAAAAADKFAGGGGERVHERFEFLHFAAWTPAASATSDG